MKTCEDCGDKYDRASVVCEPCAKKRQRVSQQAFQNRARGRNRKPCRACGEKLGLHIPAAERYCSDECRCSKDMEKRKEVARNIVELEKAHMLLKQRGDIYKEKIFIEVPKNPKGYINPMFLVRNYSGNKLSMSTGLTSITGCA
tara:strand:+ start:3536 stop:3967 length:432 start_codon:yes stop_codon:yes gene_type:complete